MITLIYHNILHYGTFSCNSHIAQRWNLRFVHNNHRKLYVVSAAKRHPQLPFRPHFSAIFSPRFATAAPPAAQVNPASLAAAV